MVISGCKCTGIYPINTIVFSETDFIAVQHEAENMADNRELHDTDVDYDLRSSGSDSSAMFRTTTRVSWRLFIDIRKPRHSTGHISNSKYKEEDNMKQRSENTFLHYYNYFST